MFSWESLKPSREGIIYKPNKVQYKTNGPLLCSSKTLIHAGLSTKCTLGWMRYEDLNYCGNIILIFLMKLLFMLSLGWDLSMAGHVTEKCMLALGQTRGMQLSFFFFGL